MTYVNINLVHTLCSGVIEVIYFKGNVRKLMGLRSFQSHFKISRRWHVNKGRYTSSGNFSLFSNTLFGFVWTVEASLIGAIQATVA